MSNNRAIVWFRNDLRLHDNEALTEALKHADEIIPVYVFDERIFGGKTRYGFPKTGVFRANFVLQSVEDLRNSFRARGAELLVRIGKPEEEIAKIAEESKANWVYCNRERTREEVLVQDALEQKLWSTGRELRYCRGKMLYYTSDLPFPVAQTPDIFTQFRKEVERFVPVRPPLPVPAQLKPAKPSLVAGDLPDLRQLGYLPLVQDRRAVLSFQGGEQQGLARLRYYLWETDLIKTYKETRNGLLGGDYSTKFSPWLAHGCLSPKQIYAEVRQYEVTRGNNESTYWVIFELLWRDFFRLMAKKYGDRIFLKGGILGKANASLRDDLKGFQRWKDGHTGKGIVDANMRELAATGFMSNRGRQIVASYLVNDLRVNWQIGAEYFESLLIDYDPASNWGNWNYVAGVGNDPRENRYFNPKTQAERYDPEGKYVRHWLSESIDTSRNASAISK